MRISKSIFLVIILLSLFPFKVSYAQQTPERFNVSLLPNETSPNSIVYYAKGSFIKLMNDIGGDTNGGSLTQESKNRINDDTLYVFKLKYATYESEQHPWTAYYWFMAESPDLSASIIINGQQVPMEVGFRISSVTKKSQFVLASKVSESGGVRLRQSIFGNGQQLTANNVDDLLNFISDRSALMSTPQDTYPPDEAKLMSVDAELIGSTTPIGLHEGLYGDSNNDGKCGGTPSPREIINWIPCFLAELSYRLFYGLMKWPLDS